MPAALSTIEKTPPVSFPDSPESRRAADVVERKTILVIDGEGDLGFDFAARADRASGSVLVVADRRPPKWDGDSMTCDEFISASDSSVRSGDGSGLLQRSLSRLVLFFPLRPTGSFAALVDRCACLVARNGPCRVCLVGSFRAHFDDALSAVETSVEARFHKLGAGTTVLRSGHVDGGNGRRGNALVPSAWYPLFPRSVTSVFLSRDELYSAIDRVIAANAPTRRKLTLLGRRRPLREVLAERRPPGALTTSLIALARLLSWMQIGRLVGLLVFAAGRLHGSLRHWRATTLAPTSLAELLSLCNPLNRQHVALAGYNTGVTHFGWKYPGRTVVSTVGCGRLVRVGERHVTVDAGVLLKQVVEELSARGKELYVLPNYSYISLGTTFMVPVHGSASEVSTLGDTIEQAIVYDPHADRISRIRRGDERFGRWMYNPSSGILVLRLRLRIREKARYFVNRTRLESPEATQLWRTLADPCASNVEIRKSRAADSAVEVSRYGTAPSDSEALEFPRDSIGRLWDRLEENRVTSWLFHACVRRFGFHVELFLNEREFDVFWRLHATLPLSKLQLRFVRCDHLSHSPFGDCDRVSVDLFMKRRHSAAFLAVMKEHLPHARFNPGKHSM